MQIKNWKKEIFTIPNVLSMIRLALIPLYIYIYLNAKTDAHYYISAGILAVSCLTDLIDGQIARRCNMISTLGKMLDPFADKATQFTLIICLAIRRNLPLLWLLIALFVAKEGFQKRQDPCRRDITRKDLYCRAVSFPCCYDHAPPPF